MTGEAGTEKERLDAAAGEMPRSQLIPDAFTTASLGRVTVLYIR